MQRGDRFASRRRQQISHILPVVLKQILSQTRRAFRAVQDREVFLLVAVAVRHVGADLRVRRQMLRGGVVEAFRKAVPLRLSLARPRLPAARRHPCRAASGGVVVD